MPRIICPDCRKTLTKTTMWVRENKNLILKAVDTSIRVCPAGDSVTRRYCEDCGFNHLQTLEDIRIQSCENPEYEEEDY
jgi:Zn ribbon nucleic-acid-binding protein